MVELARADHGALAPGVSLEPDPRVAALAVEGG
jgi:hypothetical protein